MKSTTSFFCSLSRSNALFLIPFSFFSQAFSISLFVTLRRGKMFDIVKFEKQFLKSSDRMTRPVFLSSWVSTASSECVAKHFIPSFKKLEKLFTRLTGDLWFPTLGSLFLVELITLLRTLNFFWIMLVVLNIWLKMFDLTSWSLEV